jgi:rod shape-determining protein MreC
MNKKIVPYLFFLLLIALFMGALYLNNAIQSPLISLLNSVKVKYHSSVQYIDDTITQHFYQAEEIKTLNEQLKKYQRESLELQAIRRAIKDIEHENNTTLTLDPRTVLVRTISYQKFGDFNRLWLDVPDYNNSKIYGLIYHNKVAGIVVPKNKRPLALLNGDIKSTYAVSIGAEAAPGIAHGNNDANVVVSFIPTWYNIKVGDEVTTSGLDNIFFKGLLVGKVVSISKSQGYQRAVVEQYYKTNEPSYFHMIRRTQ